MENRWSDDRAAQFIKQYRTLHGEDLAMGFYSASLIGAEDQLVLHGGGNSSVKTVRTNLLGEKLRTIFVKASGYDMALIKPEGYTGLNLDHLEKLKALPELSDQAMANEFRANCLQADAANPSIETLVHAFIPFKFVDHTHPDSILALTNQIRGEKLLREALGDTVGILGYFHPGFSLAKAVAEELSKNPNMRALILMKHGLLTFGDTAKSSYELTIKVVSKAEKFLRRHTGNSIISASPTPISLAEKRLLAVAPMIRGLLASPTENPDRPWNRCILMPLINKQILDLVNSDKCPSFAATPPLTADHLIRTKPFYLWIKDPQFDNIPKLRAQLVQCLKDYAFRYDAYLQKYSNQAPDKSKETDSLPRVLLIPGLGVLSAEKTAKDAGIVRDIAAHTLKVKAQIAAMGVYRGMDEKALYEMEFRTIQRRKLLRNGSGPLDRTIALVTGAAGAIGAGVTQELLDQGCHVAISDLEGDRLDRFVEEMKALYGSRVMGVALDITDPQSVARGFGAVARTWGGIDLIILNAGIAHVASLADMNLDAFRKIEKINVEGTLIMLSEAARLFKIQGTGGDIVMISTKNVFAPGANFGAYSATKAAGHQLARIASQEFAGMDVRINMVAPDAVFSHGARRSGLWMEVGPERMSARGLSPEGLEEYYRNRNLLKAKVTARHVGRAVLFFATRQTPTTGVTIPVDGGLPDATPR